MKNQILITAVNKIFKLLKMASICVFTEFMDTLILIDVKKFSKDKFFKQKHKTNKFFLDSISWNWWNNFSFLRERKIFKRGN